MNSSVLNGDAPLLSLLLAWVAALALLSYPMARDYGEDGGDGQTLVLLPPPKLPVWQRTAAFGVVFLASNVLYHSIRGADSLDNLYSRAVEQVANHAVVAPAQVAGYLDGFRLGLRFLVVGTMLSLALTCRAGLGRRLALVLQIGWYVLAVFLFDSILTVAAVTTGLGVSPGTLIGNGFAIFIGFVGLSRMLYANFSLPRPTALPFVKRQRWEDSAAVIGTTVTGMAIGLGIVFWVYQKSDPRWHPVLTLIGPIPFSFLTNAVRSGLLGILGRLTLREPSVGDERPPIEILIPAYNEAEVIEETLLAIDRAARRYGGAVHVILANDGSTDDTRQLALATIATFESATAVVIDVRHGGKSAVLNAALGQAKEDLVLRIDADTLIGEDSLQFLPRWFRDPKVGLVECLMWPRWRRSPFPRLRLFEEAKIFGVNHRIMQVVDGINVVPGVFTAFRRQPAVELGGFTVGMNGEDGDFTMRMSRDGWLTRFDPKMVVYEDVPPTFPEIREQRVRWDRATIHNQARHGPYRAGMATSKVWFCQSHLYFKRVSSPIFLMLPIYMGVYALFEGTWRTPFLVFVLFYAIAQANIMAFECALVLGYGFGRKVGWVVFWPLWQYMLLLFSTESILSLPGRDLRLVGRAKVRVTSAVVH